MLFRSQQTSAALPETLEEQPVKWRLHPEPYGLWILCLTLAGTGLISFAYDHDLEKEGEARQEALALAYPSFLARVKAIGRARGGEGRRSPGLPDYLKKKKNKKKKKKINTCRRRIQAV